jgi:thiamine kinase-like enzyme
MSNLHIIVQAGGRGSRLRHHTWNKPKCLVSIQGKPILYHLFDQFSNAKFHIIGDYAFDQLEKYLEVNPPLIDYVLHNTEEKGTLAGIAKTIEQIPATDQILLIWGDLIITQLPILLSNNLPVVYTTEKITCRWTYQNGTIKERPGAKGIPGLFYFPQASILANVPPEGEFVEWFSDNVPYYDVVSHDQIEEMGDFALVELQNDRLGFSRFFNKVTINNTTVTKQVLDKNYEHLIKNEQSWYQEVSQLGFNRIPKVISNEPYVMTKISGNHPYQMFDLSIREKRSVLSDYIDTLTNLHSLGSIASTHQEVIDTYITKTIDRVTSVSTLIPNFDQETITVNGIKCRNIFNDAHKSLFEDILKELQTEFFTPIHGDPTFSNSLVDDNLRVWFIDPRGYFSKPGIWGDPLYDFAKVYYSSVGGYDIFNRRKFKLHVDSETIEILMEPTIFIDCAEDIFISYFGNNLTKIKILHGLIWLSLSGYVRDDIDSIIASFYLGLYYLEQGLKKL